MGASLVREARASLARNSTSSPYVDGVCHGPREIANGACPTARLLSAGAVLGAGASGWRQAGGSPPPQSAYDFQLVYDPADGYVLLFGAEAGQYGGAGATDTWTYRAGNWTPLYAASSPVSCPGSSMAYDDSDGYIVYFGGSGSPYGSGSCSSAGQTWTYLAGTWTQLTTISAPSTRYGASLTNDTGDGYLVLFGGVNRSCSPNWYCNDTWKFSQGQWSELYPSHAPSPRSDAGIAYDTADGYVVLFAGSSGNYYSPLNDTWKFAAGVWTQLHPAQSPPVPQPDAFSYDAADRAVVYTNAYNWTSYGNAQEITWTFQAGNWSPVNFTSGPVQRLGAGTTYDAADGYLLMFGGLGGTDLSDSWGLHASTWTNLTKATPAPRVDAALTYDAADGYALLFGGSTCPPTGSCAGSLRSETWTYSSSQWTNRSPTTAPGPRSRAGMVYDASDGYVLLFGGGGPTGALNDTWEYTAGHWTQITPTRSPSPRSGQGLVYDAADGYVLLFGGDRFGGHPYADGNNDTWTYHAGVWSNLTGNLTTSPPRTTTNPLVYDPAEGYVLLFGTYASFVSGYDWSTSSPQTWAFRGGSWTNLSGSAGAPPPSRTDAMMMDDAHDGVIVLFGGAGALPLTWLGDTWSFSNGSWLRQFPTVAPDNRSDAAFAYDPTLPGGLLIGGTNSYGTGQSWQYGAGCPNYICTDTWEWTSGVGSRPFISSFVATPGTVDVGYRAIFTTNATGGSPPLSYSYGNLPSGCYSADQAKLPCTPLALGSFSVTVNVTDRLGNTSRATVALHVVARPSIASFNSTPARVALGGRAVLQTTISAGIPPYSYAYSGLPPGCSSQTVPALPCTPSTSGNFTVRVMVTDGDGAVAFANLTVDVIPAGGGSHPMVTSFAASPSALVLGNATNLSASATGGSGPLSYTFTGLPASCASTNQSLLRCVPGASGTYSIVLTVTDSAASSTSVGTNLTVYPVGGGAGALITGFSPTTPFVVLGGGTSFVVVANGGVGPLSFTYAGLPAGCRSANLSTLPCTPARVGTYDVRVTVSDSDAHAVWVTTVLSVVPLGGVMALILTSFNAVPATIHLGSSTVLAVATAGGAGTLRFDYAGLPPGCSTSDTPTLSCDPTAAGTYSVVVQVTDAIGTVVNGSARLVVEAGNGGGLPGPGGGALTGSTGTYELIAAGLGVGAIAGAISALLWRRKNGSRPPK